MSNAHRKEKEKARKLKAQAKRLRKRKGRATLRTIPASSLIPGTTLRIHLPP
jgi:hypothetical protein